MGQGLAAWSWESVTLLDAAGEVTSSATIPDPDGVGVDSTGMYWGTGSGEVWKLHSLVDGGPNEAWFHTCGNNNDLTIDPVGDVLYVAQNEGAVWRIDSTGAQNASPTGDAVAVDMGAEGEVWVHGRMAGGLWSIDPVTLEAVLEAELAALDPSWITSNRVAFNPVDGKVYTSSYFADAGGQIVRWDPNEPDVLDHWTTGLNNPELNPDGVEWHDGCLYWTAPLAGKIYRVCECP